MAYLLSNICAKNYWNRTTIVEIIVGGWAVSFLRHSVKTKTGIAHRKWRERIIRVVSTEII